MSTRESRASREFNRGMEVTRHRMEEKMKEMEEKLRTTAKFMVLKERSFWKSDRQQLLCENKNVQQQLSVTGKENRRLKADLQEARREMDISEQRISSLQQRLSALEATRDEEISALQQHVSVLTEKKLKEISSLHRSLLTQKQETERERDEKEQVIRKETEKRRRRTNAHVDTLVQLNDLEAALKKRKLACTALEEKLRDTENKLKDQNCLRELSDELLKFRGDFTKLSKSLKVKFEQLEEEKRDLEEKLLDKETFWLQQEAERKEDVQRLAEENLHPQTITVNKKQKKYFWSQKT